MPVLATLCDAGGYLSIPCCAWGFDERFTRNPTFSVSTLSRGVGQEDPNMEEKSFIESLNLGAEGSHKSQYSAYRIWLAQLSSWMGWKVECEVLRIPSTRNWGLVGTWRDRFTLIWAREIIPIGRERLYGDVDLHKHRARGIIVEVVTRGVFKTRRPEGKAGGH